MEPHVQPGHPDNWPRRIARKHKDAAAAVEALVGQVDEYNMAFALREFIAERVRMARGLTTLPPSKWKVCFWLRGKSAAPRLSTWVYGDNAVAAVAVVRRAYGDIELDGVEGIKE